MSDFYESPFTGVEIDQVILYARYSGLKNASDYSEDAIYSTGAYCINDGKLYRCITAISSAEPWTPANWEETSVGAELMSIYTTLANNDPRQWGLGTDSKTTTDWNNEKTNGWVRDIQGTEDKHSPFVGRFSVGLISEYQSGGDTFQLAFTRDQYEKTRTYIKFRAYNADENLWGEWEWVNPPMKLGKEYRTTERYLGKPVYAIAVDFGNLPNATTKEVTVSGVSSADKIVSVFGYTSDSKTIPTFYYGWGAVSTTLYDAIALDASFHSTLGLIIHISTQLNRSSSTAVVIVKYTKSTD